VTKQTTVYVTRPTVDDRGISVCQTTVCSI